MCGTQQRGNLAANLQGSYHLKEPLSVLAITQQTKQADGMAGKPHPQSSLLIAAVAAAAEILGSNVSQD